MFQLALLLSADACAAEVALRNSIDELEVTRPPRQGDLAAWQHTVVARSITTRATQKPAVALLYRSMLHSGLWPLMQIERFPRTCFVLRLLLGYPRPVCAQLLGIEQTKLRGFFRQQLIRFSAPGRRGIDCPGSRYFAAVWNIARPMSIAEGREMNIGRYVLTTARSGQTSLLCTFPTCSGVWRFECSSQIEDYKWNRGSISERFFAPSARSLSAFIACLHQRHTTEQARPCAHQLGASL